MRGLAVGLGYRRGMHSHYLGEAAAGAIDFVELAPENYSGLGGDWRRRLDAIRARYPVVTHGLALSLGGTAPLDRSLVDAVAAFTSEVGSPHHSDHLCWSSTEGSHLHELLPVPFTRANARRIAGRIQDVASALPVPLAIENVSSYARHAEDELEEADFASEVVALSGCKLLLDVNNVYVNSVNFGFDPHEMLSRYPCSEVVQIHVAGHRREAPDLVIDTHGEAIADPVYQLLGSALERTGPVPVLLERDGNYPPFEELLAEIERLRAVALQVLGPDSVSPDAMSPDSVRKFHR